MRGACQAWAASRAALRPHSTRTLVHALQQLICELGDFLGCEIPPEPHRVFGAQDAAQQLAAAPACMGAASGHKAMPGKKVMYNSQSHT